MKIGDWRRLTDYWQRHPPACELAEIATAWRPEPVGKPATEEDLRALDALVNGGG